MFAFLILLHIPLLFVIITKWLMEGYFDIKGLKEKKFLILISIAKDLGMENKTSTTKNLNFFFLVGIPKRVRDYYAPYVANIGKIEGDIWESRKKVNLILYQDISMEHYFQHNPYQIFYAPRRVRNHI